MPPTFGEAGTKNTSSAGQTGGGSGGGGMSVESVTPTAVEKHVTVNAGGISGGPVATWPDPLRRRGALNVSPAVIPLLIAAGALAVALFLLRRK